MKTTIIIIRILITILVVIILLSTFVELDIARRAYEYSNEEYLNGDYLKFFKTIEDVNENRINSYEYRYGVFKIMLILESITVFLVLLLLFLQWKVKKVD